MELGGNAKWTAASKGKKDKGQIIDQARLTSSLHVGSTSSLPAGPAWQHLHKQPQLLVPSSEKRACNRRWVI